VLNVRKFTMPLPNLSTAQIGRRLWKLRKQPQIKQLSTKFCDTVYP
jgi:hypothetical protein